MSSFSQEHLLGYVLGALEEHERDAFERELARSAELARQVELLAERLQPLEQCRHTEPPPAGLAIRTCAFVFEQTTLTRSVSEDSSLTRSVSEDLVTRRTSEDTSVSDDQKVSLARRGLAAAMSDEVGHTSSWTLSDAIVAAGIFIAAGLLFFPAIANSRYQAQLTMCQNNLRQLGVAHLAARTAHPELDVNNVTAMPDKRAFAGIQPILWNDMGYLDRENLLVCPASKDAAQRSDWRLPTCKEIDSASDKVLDELRRRAGGSLAFSLGQLPKHSDRVADNADYLAIAADAPSGSAPPQLVSTHHNNGENVLFDSGRVAFICGCGDEECGDSIYWNRDFRIAPGLDDRDSCLARPGTRVLAEELQRMLEQ